MAAPKGSKNQLKSAAPEPETVKSSDQPDQPVHQDPAPPLPESEGPKDNSTNQEEDSKPEAEEEAPPPPVPKRPLSPFSKSLKELEEAFPDSQSGINRAVLVAANGNLEQAFNGMLALTDETIRPVTPPSNRIRPQSPTQIKKDEQLARQLASQYDRPRRPRPRHSGSRPPEEVEDYDEGPGGIDDLKDNLSRGLSETGARISSFWGQLRERFNNEIHDDDDFYGDEELDDDSGVPPPAPPRRPLNRPSHGEFVEAPLPARSPGFQRPVKSSQQAAQEPVNVFGDTAMPNQSKSSSEPPQEEPEPDAFFIGESDDDDLGSLEDGDKADKDKDKDKPTETTNQPSTSIDVKSGTLSESALDQASSPSKPSAKELLSKFKTET